MYLYSQVAISYHPAKFVSHRHSGSGHVMVFVCRMTLQDHLIKALNDFMVRSPSRCVTILPSLVVMGTAALDL